MSANLRVFHLLHRAHSALFRAADTRLKADIGLTAAQHTVLLALKAHDAQPITVLAGALRLRKSSMSEIVARMEARGLVCRVAHPQDARVARVSLTVEGRELLSRTGTYVRRMNEELLAPFSAEDRAVIARFLTHVDENADAILRTPVPATENEEPERGTA